MGQETKQSRYTKKEEKEFLFRLKQETKWLKSHITDPTPRYDSPLLCGYEAEGWIINRRGLPYALSDRLLKDISDPHITPELSRFNFEINGNAFPVDKALPGSLREDFHNYWQKCVKAVEQHDGKVLFIGTYPDLTRVSFGMNEMFPRNRYYAINERIKKLRNGPARVHIRGKETLLFEAPTIMHEAETTSLQIHLQVPFSRARDFYNSSLIASPIMSALCANSPYVCGKELWSDSRIPVFEQVIALKIKKGNRLISRVGLGEGFVKKSISELFEQNLKHSVLLPEVKDTKKEKLQHLLFHNGTVWRWNRPIISVDKEGRLHFRVEHRVPSAGPTLVDMQANILFFIGLSHLIERHIKNSAPKISFQELENDFYLTSQMGFLARVKWLDGSTGAVRDLLMQKLIPLVWKELKQLSLDCPRADFLINQVIKTRVNLAQNGSAWQTAFIHKFGKNFDKMMLVYWENQKTNTPVCEWKV